MAILRENRYGKTGVRLLKVTRRGAVHDVREWTVRVLLEGDFAQTHTHGDNTDLLATDTMKNAVYSRANESDAESPEAFAAELSEFLLSRNPRVSTVEVRVEQALWKRLTIDGEPHPHSFMRGSRELAVATLRRTRDSVQLHCGIEEMVVLKTAQSGFRGFKRDELTTLKETDDRLLGTSVTASWHYAGDVSPSLLSRANELRHTARESLLRTFTTHESKSVQQTLYAMAENALSAVPELAEVTLTLPNRHNLLVDLSPFGQTNTNEIFMPIDEPSGYIEARVTRS